MSETKLKNSLGDMFIDWAQGMSQKEMEKKYNVVYSTITRRCKQITEKLFNGDSKYLFNNVEKIRKDVDKIAPAVLKCRYCGQPKYFWGDKE